VGGAEDMSTNGKTYVISRMIAPEIIKLKNLKKGEGKNSSRSGRVLSQSGVHLSLTCQNIYRTISLGGGYCDRVKYEGEEGKTNGLAARASSCDQHPSYSNQECRRDEGIRVQPQSNLIL